MTQEMFRECPFCGRTHRSEFVEEIEDQVLFCKRIQDENWLRDGIEPGEASTSPISCVMSAVKAIYGKGEMVGEMWDGDKLVMSDVEVATEGGRGWRFLFMGRRAAEGFRAMSPYVVISITDPGSEPVEFRDPLCRGVLPLQFWDLEAPAGRFSELFTMEMAREIVRFAEHFSAVRQIMVHCEAGISRSCAVAASLAKRFTGDDERVRRRGHPNPLVYRLMLEALAELPDRALPAAPEAAERLGVPEERGVAE